MKRKSLTFIIAFGPEVRAFLYSGLLTALQKNYDVSVVTVRPESAAYKSFDGIPYIKMPETRLSSGLAQLHSRANQSHRFRLAGKGRQIWRHYLPNESTKQRLSWRQKFRKSINNSKIWSIVPVQQILELAVWRWGINRQWKSLFTQLQTDCLILSPYSHPRVLPAIYTAHNMGIKLIHVNNSWKDIYTNPYVSIIPDRFVVWNSQAANHIFEANPNLKNRIEVSTSLHLQMLLSPSIEYLSREKFCNQISLDPTRPYINYTAASPAATLNEEAIVESILEAIQNNRFLPSPQVLLRLNPMENGDRFARIANKFPNNLIIQKPEWEWLPDLDWCCALPLDVYMWQNTIYHAAFNISIPSTVTLEYLALRKAVINVAFDSASVPASISNRRFWEADFYMQLRKNKLVMPAFSHDELIMLISRQLEAMVPMHASLELDLFPNRNPVQHLTRVISEVVENT